MVGEVYWVDYILGIILAMVSTILFNIAPILQKEVLDDMESIESGNMGNSYRIMFKNKKWVFGMSLGIIGSLPYFFAMQLAGVMVTQPLMNFGFVVLVIAAKKRLGETLPISAKFAIFLMIIMPIFIVLAQVNEPQLFQSPDSLIYFTIISEILTISGILISKKIPIVFTLGVGLNFALGALYLNAFTLSVDFSADLPILIDSALNNIIYGIFAGVFNSFAVLISQIGLQKNEASRYNPIQQTINNTASLFGGLIIFLQVAQEPVFYAIAFILGVIGMFILGKYEE